MTIGRDVGKLSWEDVSSNFRKGNEQGLWVKSFSTSILKSFKKGGQMRMEYQKKKKQKANLGPHQHYGAVGHLIALMLFLMALLVIGVVLLSLNFPLEFAAACLRNIKDEDQGIKLLREVAREGLSYKPFDKFKSEINWSVQGRRIDWWFNRH